jgi:hypothetical protein
MAPQHVRIKGKSGRDFDKLYGISKTEKWFGQMKSVFET